jgi:acetyl-CoA C-acetyltransferase
MKNQTVVIVSAKRTPIGRFMGGLAAVPATALGATAIKGALAEAGIAPESVDEVFMGHVLQAGTGQAPARQAALQAGIPDTVPCTTVNKVCASGMKAIMLAAQAIALGDAEVVVAGGMENMSLAPHFSHLRVGQKFGGIHFEDTMQKDGLTDAFDQVAMGTFADATAEKHQISREEQDAFAKESYTRSANAWNAGAFTNEVVPVTINDKRKGEITIAEDEEFKAVQMEKIASLRPAFSPKGTVTAANASTINDGAAALVLMSAQKAKALNLTPLATIKAYADAAHEPQWFTTAPAKALPKVVAKAAWTLAEVEAFELNEAFSVVGLVNIKLLGLDPQKVNMHGGAVSLGHPLGCSGARIVVTLLHAMKQKQLHKGIAAICNGGGGASALALEC